MSKNDPRRERRLAEALRANLKKRKLPKEQDIAGPLPTDDVLTPETDVPKPEQSDT